MADTDVALVTRNRLLGRLPENEMVRLTPLFERIEIKPQQILHHWNVPMDHVYFVESGLVSVMAKTSDREWGEVWLIGSDGMTGIPIVLGDIHPPHRRVVQMGGSALHISTQAFRHLLEVSEPLRGILLNYIQVVLLQTSQSGACSAYREATTCTLVAPRTRHTGVQPVASATRDVGTIDWGEASNNYRLSKRL
jgi:CRP-like cAMP-binding protein